MGHQPSANPFDKPRAFISYARKDGEAFASGLRDRIAAVAASELHPWRDRDEMVGDQGWWNQITQAIDDSHAVLLVLTPGALASPVVAEEWRYARRRGVPVFPISVPDAPVDYAALPRWMAKSHVYDLDKEWDKFFAHLKAPPETVRAPFMPPPLPEGFVQRPAEFEALIAHLLDADRGDPVAITTALHGAGGFGKTTLALALCHDPRVRDAFDDGILRVTLGETPNVQNGLTKLYDALTGGESSFKDPEEAAFRLRERLAGRNCLVVVDDVWNAANLRPFLAAGDASAHLFTTRDFGIAAGAAKARRVNVDRMKPGEAVELLLAPFPDRPADEAPFRAMAGRLGDWPLLLDLAAAALRARVDRGESPADALAYVTSVYDEDGVCAFDQTNAEERGQAVSRTMDVSLGFLKGRERDDYLNLAVFPEDVDVPYSALKALWGLSDVATKRLAERLDGLSLLKLSAPAGTVRLHDVVRAYLATRVPDLVVANAAIVDGWGDPHRLPDGYAWRWVGHHLAGAGRAANLRRLLFDFQWLQAKLDRTDAAAVVDEFEHVRDDADAALVQGAVRLASHVLARDKAQLAGQLVGRLLSQPSAAVQGLLGQARRDRPPPWLCPRRQALQGPGSGLLRTLAGHAGDVSAVAVTPDGRLAVSGSSDNTVRVWDLATGAEVRALVGHAGWVRAVAVTPDGRAVSGSVDHTRKVWDLETGAEVRALAGHAGWVRAVAVTPDGRLAVSGSDDNTLKVWDLETGQCVATFTSESGFRACAVTADGVTIVAGDVAGGVHILRLVLSPFAAPADTPAAPPGGGNGGSSGAGGGSGDSNDDNRGGGRRYPGWLKRAVCGRMAADWQDLADQLELPLTHRSAFVKGREPHGVWEWLEDRGRLADLGPALEAVGRGDLAALVRDAGG